MNREGRSGITGKIRSIIWHYQFHSKIMEVLPCSGVQYVGESDCSQQSSGTAFTYEGESNCVEPGKQVPLADGRLSDVLLSVEGPRTRKQGEISGTGDKVPTSEGHCGGTSYSDGLLESQNISCSSHDFEEDDVNVHDYNMEPCTVSENSHIIVDTIEGEFPNNREEESSLSEPTWLEGDESVALWVKVTANFFTLRNLHSKNFWFCRCHSFSLLQIIWCYPVSWFVDMSFLVQEVCLFYAGIFCLSRLSLYVSLY